jgi:hypothetical protein
MKDKVTYVVFTSGAEILSDALDVESNYSEIVEVNPAIKSWLVRALRAFSYKFNFLEKFWFNRELKKVSLQNLDLTNYKVIIFDAPIWINNIHRFSEVFDKNKVKFWFWNATSNGHMIARIQDEVASVASFDSEDCINFGMTFLPQFHLNFEYNLTDEETIFDVLFVGRVKNRLSEIENFYSQCLLLGLNVYFHVKRDRYFQKSEVLSLKDKDISYYAYLKLVSQSRVILEINESNTSGLSLRAIESLFYDKKLVTNNSQIKKYDFYDPRNILVLDNLKGMSVDFLNSKSEKIDHSIKKKYLFSEWLKRI